MNDKNPSEIQELLTDDFVWHIAVPEHKVPADDKAYKAKTIEFTLRADIRIRDYNTIFDINDVLSVIHDDGTKGKSWRHLVGDYPES